MMIHHRIAKHNPLVWSGYLDGCDLTALKVVCPHLFVFQPEKRHMHARTECQSAQVVCGARTKHVGLSHRELMTGIKSDVQSDALKELMQRLAAINTTPSLPEARQGEEADEEPEEQLGAASSSSATLQSEQTGGRDGKDGKAGKNGNLNLLFR